MKKFYALMAFAAASLAASAGEVTDVISASTIEIPETYSEQEVTLASGAVYLVTLKDDGNGPQFKAGTSGVVTKTSAGTVARVEVSWGSKSNEDIEVYGQHTPYATSSSVIGGTLLGTIEFTTGSTASLTIEGEWEYIGITTTAKKGKAAQVGTISLVWNTAESTPDEACDGVMINEVCGDDGTKDGNEDWVELYNPTSKVLDLSGVKVVKTDEDGVSEVLCTIAEGTTLAADGYFVVEKGTHFTQGLSNNKNMTINLVSPLDKRLGMFDKVSALTHNGSHPKGGSYSYAGSGKWVSTTVSTKGAVNEPYPPVAEQIVWYEPVTAETLKDGLKVIAINRDYNYVMSYQWNTTKDGSVYLYGYDAIKASNAELMAVDMNQSAAAVVKLVDGGDGTWALKFVDTNNYLNDSRFMACTKFKNIDFKKNDDPTKGTRATITFNTAGDAEISYGEGGVIKFNYKDDGTSRFFNYDPLDKPEEHLAVYLYTEAKGSSAISSIDSDDSEPVYYNLQGIRVDNPQSGLYIKRSGRQSTKVMIR